MWVLWPSFLAAGAVSAAVFALVDPLDITFLGYLNATRQQVYAGGFFLFWLMAALSSALTLQIAPPRAPELDEFGEPLHY
ncbi:hypothetical protein GSY71_01855 [Pusillimonas sp. TS35]|nr:hypothetical protein [Pusillimonas sp. TS35]